jgi:hypothetical protein
MTNKKETGGTPITDAWITDTRIDMFWVVTVPKRGSTLGDIVFDSDPASYANSLKGGLDPADVIGFWIDENCAKAKGIKLLAARQAFDAVLEKE